MLLCRFSTAPVFIEPGVKDRIGESMLLTKSFYRQPAFFPIVNQVKLLLLTSFDRGFSLCFVHINRLKGKAIWRLRGNQQAVGCGFTVFPHLFQEISLCLFD